MKEAEKLHNTIYCGKDTEIELNMKDKYNIL